jgi:hypothetical protein
MSYWVCLAPLLYCAKKVEQSFSREVMSGSAPGLVPVTTRLQLLGWQYAAFRWPARTTGVRANKVSERCMIDRMSEESGDAQDIVFEGN